MTTGTRREHQVRASDNPLTAALGRLMERGAGSA
ncbi:hypothetical protein BH23GEM6_BH23GEM6_27700 [soil metagenome]